MHKSGRLALGGAGTGTHEISNDHGIKAIGHIGERQCRAALKALHKGGEITHD
jgi:hypothetical protein